MQTEIEAKFLNVNHDEVREKLQRLGAHLEQPRRLMRRVVFDFPDRRLQKEKSWVRVRDEGDRVTCTFKKAEEKVFGGAAEHEITVSDYQTAVSIFLAIGLEAQSIQESYRETWSLDGTEVVLDEWPWLKPYIEIEGMSEQAVKDVSAELGLQWKDAVFGTVITAYRMAYPKAPSDEVVSEIPVFHFDDPVPSILTEGE